MLSLNYLLLLILYSSFPPLTACYRRLLKVLKILVLSFLWFGFVAFLVGYAFELSILVPLFVRFDQCARLTFSEVWGIGFFNAATMIRVVLVIPLEAFGPWRQKIDEIRRRGFRNISMLEVIKEIIAPVSTALGIYISVPIIACEYIIPKFFSSSCFIFKGKFNGFISPSPLFPPSLNLSLFSYQPTIPILSATYRGQAILLFWFI